jgi:hypothetical protein
MKTINYFITPGLPIKGKEQIPNVQENDLVNVQEYLLIQKEKTIQLHY